MAMFYSLPGNIATIDADVKPSHLEIPFCNFIPRLPQEFVVGVYF
jgi:hypothetical protein